MEIVQIKLNKMAVFAYIIVDQQTKECIVVDPAFETKKILAIATEKGYQITKVVNTHYHADHVAGNRSILEKTRAELWIHESESHLLRTLKNRLFCRLLGGKGSPLPDGLLKHQDVIKVGESRVTVIHTPGHSPGGICLFFDGNVVTGDTLFVGAVGRTDLAGGSPEVLKRSIKERLYILSDDTIVWPGHDYGVAQTSTIRHEKLTNPFTA